MTFIVGKGFSNLGTLQILQYCSNSNGNYFYIKGVRLTTAGVVQGLFNTSPSGTTVSVTMNIFSTTGTVAPNATLTLETGTPTIIKSVNGKSGAISSDIDGTATNATQLGGIAADNYVRIDNTQTISGTKTFNNRIWTIASNEGTVSNIITSRHWENGKWGTNNNMYSIKNSLEFDWYKTAWFIGNIRGSSTDSYGFGIGNLSSDGTYINPVFRITESDTYINNQKIIHTGNIESQAIIKTLSDRITALENYINSIKNGDVLIGCNNLLPKNVRNISIDKNTRFSMVFTNVQPIKSGKVYTLQIQSVTGISNTYPYITISGLPRIDINKNGFFRKTVTATLDSSNIGIEARLNTTTYETVTLNDIMLVEGDIATSWMPSPTDMGYTV